MYSFVRIIFQALILSSLLFAACEPPPDLTPETQIGANTMSCMVNGRVWIPKGKLDLFVKVNPFFGGFYRNWDNGGLNLQIFANKYPKSGSKRDDLEIFVYECSSPGVYLANQTTTTDLSKKAYIWFQDGKTGKSYITFPGHEGKITVTRADTANLILSGTFEGTLGNSLGETIRITNGRFDINQKTQNM